MSRHSSSASTRRMNTLVPPATNVANVCINVPMWNSGPQFRYTSSPVVPVTAPCTRSWAMHARVRRARAVRAAAERGGVDDETPASSVDRELGVVGGAGREERLVASIVGRRCRGGSTASGACASRRAARARRRRSPAPATRRRAGVRSSITNASSSAVWRQFAGQNSRAELRRRAAGARARGTSSGRATGCGRRRRRRRRGARPRAGSPGRRARGT